MTIHEILSDIPFNISYMKVTFHAEFLESTIMPADKVSALRGGMGEMMLRQYCVADRNCRDCRFHKGCILKNAFYSRMEKCPPYMTGEDSVGYLLECEDRGENYEKGDVFSFQMILFGDSIAFFYIYLQAFSMLGASGIGKYQSRYRIVEVLNGRGQPIVSDNWIDSRQYLIEDIGSYVIKRKEQLSRKDGEYAISFRTPLSIKYRGEYLSEFQEEAIVMGACRRVQMLNYYIGQETELPAIDCWPEIKSKYARMRSVERYSSTHDTKVVLRGIVGKVVFSSMPEDCLEYLIAGELLHIGKNTSFGFGKYRIDKKK